MTPARHELHLFDADRTVPTQCPDCHHTRQPQDTHVADCPIDTARNQGAGWVARPQTCLNHPRPEHDPFPDGY